LRLCVTTFSILFAFSCSHCPTLAADGNKAKAGPSKEDWIALRESRASQAPGIFAEVLMISSLTPGQRLRIGTIYRQWKSANKQLVSKLIAAGHGSTTKEKEISSEILAGLISPSTDANRFFKPSNSRKSGFTENDAYKQIADQYRLACFRIGGVLTESQKKELDQMRVICGSPDYSRHMIGPPASRSDESQARKEHAETKKLHQ